ncbi:MAG: Transcription elongation factor GreA [Turneriella sp.]|nr:Transcription elongation factor GreA [Turneriella sp.]
MSETTTASTPTSVSEGDTLEARIQSQFNEEKWTRLSAKDVSISRFKILEQLLDEVKKQNKHDFLRKEALAHLAEYEPSIAAHYFLGMLALERNIPDEIIHLKTLLDQFQEASKWAVVDYLSEKMLAVTRTRTILRARANALEKLGKHKEAIPVLEQLALLDRKNPDIALKYADAILADDLEKGIQFYKQAAEAFARNLQFEKLKTTWTRLIELLPDDFNFYKKIERILAGHRQKDIIAELYVLLANYFIKKEDHDKVMLLSKKILEYNPNYARFKNELLRTYREKYKSHSLLEDFIRYSGLLDTRKNLSSSILNFETNIVFDKGNYVFHRSWGVGKIVDLTTKEMVIDFKDKKAHKMDIQMALKSLKPLREEHFWVMQFEKPEETKKLFQSDITQFFKILLHSFGGKLSLADIKTELTDKYVPLTQWSKWWSKVRPELMKDDLIDISPQRKDTIELHDTPVSKAEVVMEKFQAAHGFEDRVQAFVDALKLPSENFEAIEFIAPHFRETLKSLDANTRLKSLFLLELAAEALADDEPLFSKEQQAEVIAAFQKMNAHEVTEFISEMKQSELKRHALKFTKRHHDNWRKIYSELLFETPVKLHKAILSELTAAGATAEIADFVSRIRKDAKDNAEVFLWMVKSILSGSVELPSEQTQESLLSLFRILKSLPKIEQKGSKLKNTARDIFFGNAKQEFFDTIEKQAKENVRRFAALLKDVPFFNDAEKTQIISQLREINPTVFEAQGEEFEAALESESLASRLEKSGATVASATAIETMKARLDQLINVDIPKNSEEIGVAQEKGDLRENAEYKAALENQSILQAEAKQLEADIKTVQILAIDDIDTKTVAIGTRVKLRDSTSGDIFIYSILDQWDADVDKGIISYKSPLGQALMGARKGAQTSFNNQKLEIIGIEKAIDTTGHLI